MRDIQSYKICGAEQRMQKIMRLIAKFQDDETFSTWGVKVNTQMTPVQGKKLEEPRVIHQNQTREMSAYYNRKIPMT